MSNFFKTLTDPTYLQLVSMGLVPDHNIIIISGHNPSLSNVIEEDITHDGGTRNYLESAERLNISSTSVNDSVGGTGLNAVIVRGLLGDYEEIDETVLLNGTNNVLTQNSFLRVNQMIGVDAGNLESNDGDISAFAQIAGTLQEEIAAGEGFSHSAFYTVPKGKKCLPIYFDFSIIRPTPASSAVIDFRVLSKQAGLYQRSPWYQVAQMQMETSVSNFIAVKRPAYRQLFEKGEFKVVAKTESSNMNAAVNAIFLQVPMSV